MPGRQVLGVRCTAETYGRVYSVARGLCLSLVLVNFAVFLECLWDPLIESGFFGDLLAKKNSAMGGGVKRVCAVQRPWQPEI